MLVYVLFYLGQLSHFPSCCGASVTNLNELPSSFFLPPHYCGLGAGSIPFRAIVYNKQCEMRGLFMSLVIHYWIGDVQDCQGVSASEMTCIVSSGALNSTHSLTSENKCVCCYCCCVIPFSNGDFRPGRGEQATVLCHPHFRTGCVLKDTSQPRVSQSQHPLTLEIVH